MENLSNGGIVPPIETVFVVALYNAKTGVIRHLHTSVIFKGGRKILEKEAVSIAKSNALQQGHGIKGLKVLASTDIKHSQGPHRIDVKNKRFIKLRAPRINSSKSINAG